MTGYDISRTKRCMQGLALLVLALACDHTSPFDPVSPAPAPPFSALFPRRLTFNLGDDRTPSWLPDGSGIIYSSEREDRADHDRCLAILPAEGGTVQSRYCRVDPVHEDSTDVMEAPAIGPGGRIFFHQVVSRIGRQKLGSSELRLGSADNPLEATLLRPLPYTAPNGRFHSSIRLPQWVSRDSLVYLAELLFYEGSTFLPDTFYTGVDVVLLDLAGPEAVYNIIPGTDFASSVAVSEEPGVVYYTLGGDSRVFRRTLADGDVSVVHDFGTGNIARDVQVRGSRLVAVVGQSVLYRNEEAHGFVQRDEGGDLAFVDLATSDVRVFATDSVLFRHPMISPDGKRVVVEVQPFAPVHPEPESEFNAPNHRADLWLFHLD
jgi:hypothetical protein